MKREYWPTSKWRTANPRELGLDERMLSKLNPIIRSEYGNIGGIVIVKDGHIALEHYYHGYGPDDTLHVASVTKSVLSALVGIAIEKGYIAGIEQEVVDFFPEHILDSGDRKKRDIRIKHLLTMTAPYSYETEPFQELCLSPDWTKFALDLLDGAGRIGDFKYSTAGAHLLSAIITRSTGRSAREFANEYLFSQIGMRELPDYEMSASGFMDFFQGKHVTGWVIDPTGNSTGGWGLTLTPRDMALFGFLYLNKGLWDGKQIIPSDWIANTIAPTPHHYGYLWWLFDQKEPFMYCAMGDGGNIICCIPEKDMVIAIASTFVPDPKDRVVLIHEHILSAIVD